MSPGQCCQIGSMGHFWYSKSHELQLPTSDCTVTFSQCTWTDSLLPCLFLHMHLPSITPPAAFWCGEQVSKGKYARLSSHVSYLKSTSLDGQVQKNLSSDPNHCGAFQVSLPKVKEQSAQLQALPSWTRMFKQFKCDNTAPRETPIQFSDTKAPSKWHRKGEGCRSAAVPQYLPNFTCIHHGMNRPGTQTTTQGGPFSSLITNVPGRNCFFISCCSHRRCLLLDTEQHNRATKLRPCLVHPAGFGDDLMTNYLCAGHLQSQPWRGSSATSVTSGHQTTAPHWQGPRSFSQASSGTRGYSHLLMGVKRKNQDPGKVQVLPYKLLPYLPGQVTQCQCTYTHTIRAGRQ